MQFAKCVFHFPTWIIENCYIIRLPLSYATQYNLFLFMPDRDGNKKFVARLKIYHLGFPPPVWEWHIANGEKNKKRSRLFSPFLFSRYFTRKPYIRLEYTFDIRIHGKSIITRTGQDDAGFTRLFTSAWTRCLSNRLPSRRIRKNTRRDAVRNVKPPLYFMQHNSSIIFLKKLGRRSSGW